MLSIKSIICAAVLAGLLLAGCAAQPAPAPVQGSSGGQPTSSPSPADPTAEASGATVSSSGAGNGSVQTPDPATPTPTSTGDSSASSEGIVLTMESSGHTLTLKQGQTFLLKLGETYDWQIIIADQSVVSRVKNVMVIRGAQGLYSALQPGQTELSAQGDPQCRSAKPACMQPSILFRQTIIVQ